MLPQRRRCSINVHRISKQALVPRDNNHNRSGKKLIRENDVILPPPKKKRKAQEIKAGISSRWQQTCRSAKKKLSNGELLEQLEQIQENDDTFSLFHFSAKPLFAKTDKKGMHDKIIDKEDENQWWRRQWTKNTGLKRKLRPFLFNEKNR